MARLYRPHIPLSVRCKVAERQLLQGFERLNAKVVTATRSYGERLAVLLAALAADFSCEVSDLRLDHDPPLGARQIVPAGRVIPGCWLNTFGVPVRYEPDANDPDHLFYRPHGAQFQGSHDVKTRIRGDHGQYPDRVLIKKMRRLERGPKPKKTFGGARGRLARPLSRSKKSTWPKRPFPKRRKS